MDRRQVYGGPRPPFSSHSVVHVHRVHGHVAGEGRCSPVSYRGGAPSGGKLTVSPRGGAGVRLGRGKASLGHSDCVSGVKVVARASPKVLATASGGSSSTGVREWREAMA